MRDERPAAEIDCVDVLFELSELCRWNDRGLITEGRQLFYNSRLDRQNLESVVERVVEPIMQPFVEDRIDLARFYSCQPLRRGGPGSLLYTAAPALDLGKGQPVKRKNLCHGVVSRIVDTGRTGRNPQRYLALGDFE